MRESRDPARPAPHLRHARCPVSLLLVLGTTSLNSKQNSIKGMAGEKLEVMWNWEGRTGRGVRPWGWGAPGAGLAAAPQKYHSHADYNTETVSVTVHFQLVLDIMIDLKNTVYCKNSNGWWLIGLAEFIEAQAWSLAALCSCVSATEYFQWSFTLMWNLVSRCKNPFAQSQTIGASWARTEYWWLLLLLPAGPLPCYSSFCSDLIPG